MTLIDAPGFPVPTDYPPKEKSVPATLPINPNADVEDLREAVGTITSALFGTRAPSEDHRLYQTTAGAAHRRILAEAINSVANSTLGLGISRNKTSGLITHDDDVNITGNLEVDGKIGVGTPPKREIHISKAAQTAIALADTRGAANDTTMAMVVDGAQAVSKRALVFQSLNDDGTFQSNLMSILDDATVGINTIAPDGTLHVHTGSAGTVTAASAADDFVVENSGDGGLSILCPDAKIGYIVFGNPSDNIGGVISWDYTNGKMRVTPGGTNDLVLGGGDVFEVNDERVKVTGNGYEAVDEINITPSTPTQSAQLKRYVKGDKYIFQWNDGGTVRYKYLDLTGTTTTWVHTTSPP